jgi:2-(1,2-epoxy-1,2-dihydrophenyl)acetyl-CoA isomerase
MTADLLIAQPGAVASLSLNRPDAKNALTRELSAALRNAVETADADDSVRVLVLRGESGAFCSGADLKGAFRELAAGTEFGSFIDELHGLIRAIARSAKPVIAAVDGPAVGFGADLALACDLRVLSETAYLQEKFISIGLMPDGGGTLLLPALVGPGRALEYLMLGTRLDAALALELGLANSVVPSADLDTEAARLAALLAEGPPLALAAVKRSVRAGLAGGGLDAALDREKAGQLALLASQDVREGVAAWLERRPPRFTGR